MVPILKPIFDILTGDVAVCDNVLYNYLVLLLVGEIAFRCAYSLVGDAYRSGVIGGRAAGSILHWIIRLPIYLVIAYILRTGIWVYNFIIAIPTWIWLTLLLICLLAITTTVVYSVVRKRKTAIKN